ncbi:MAG: hypothetical protein KME06_01895 [Kastovskya adunca ATA6-11-RM4]|nr:hypothetical protein [Kastovskya adunca ATA6-11-RM4]
MTQFYIPLAGANAYGTIRDRTILFKFHSPKSEVVREAIAFYPADSSFVSSLSSSLGRAFYLELGGYRVSRVDTYWSSNNCCSKDESSPVDSRASDVGEGRGTSAKI